MSEGIPSLEFLLQEYKIGHIYERLCKEGIDSVEDFYELNESDIRELSSALSLKVGERSKLIRAIKSIPQAKINTPKPTTVIAYVDKDERDALSKLASVKRELRELRKTLKASQAGVDKSARDCSATVRDMKSKMLSAVEARCEQLLVDIDSSRQKESRRLVRECALLSEMENQVSKTQEECSQIVSKNTMTDLSSTRGTDLVELANKTLNDAKVIMDIKPVSPLMFKGDLQAVENAVKNFGVLDTHRKEETDDQKSRPAVVIKGVSISSHSGFYHEGSNNRYNPTNLLKPDQTAYASTYASSSSRAESAWIIFNLGKRHYVRTIKIRPIDGTQTPKEIDIFTSNDALSWVKTVSTALNTGVSHKFQDVKTSTSECSYVKLNLISNHGGAGCKFMMTEVQFFGV